MGFLLKAYMQTTKTVLVYAECIQPAENILTFKLMCIYSELIKVFVHHKTHVYVLIVSFID